MSLNWNFWMGKRGGAGESSKQNHHGGYRYFLEQHITYSLKLTWLVAAFLAASSASSFLFSSVCLCSSISFFFFSASLFFASWASLICSFFSLAYGKHTTNTQEGLRIKCTAPYNLKYSWAPPLTLQSPLLILPPSLLLKSLYSGLKKSPDSHFLIYRTL